MGRIILFMPILYLTSTIAWAISIITAGFVRGRRAAIFVSVLLGIYTLIALTLAHYVDASILPVYTYLDIAVYANFMLLAHQRMRPLLYRLLVGWPSAWFLASTMIAFPWAIAAGLGFHPRLLFIPYVVSVLGFVDTFLAKPEIVKIALSAGGGIRSPEASVLKRAETLSAKAIASTSASTNANVNVTANDPRPLRIVQITDPHIGSFMTVARLREICERAVAQNPDLVLLTGDFLTIESNHDHSLLGEALAPLKKLPGRCFACFGNHDHESPEHVRAGLASAGVKLLVDEMIRTETEAGPIEILGFDFHFDDRKKNLEAVSARYPRTAGVTRIAMLHHPGAFVDLPEGIADLVFSGHTHGGQVGLLWFGLPHTFLSAFTKVPDHGLWSRGKDLLYVHRGTGHYGFPLRLGVPPEESVLELHWKA